MKRRGKPDAKWRDFTIFSDSTIVNSRKNLTISNEKYLSFWGIIFDPMKRYEKFENN